MQQWAAASACTVLLLLQLHAHAANSNTKLHDIMAGIAEVQVMPTVQLLEAVPRGPSHKPAAAGIDASSADVSIHVRVRSIEDDWWSPKLYSKALSSLVVRARREGAAKRTCLLMADSRQALLDPSNSRHLQLARAEGHSPLMYLLPAVINLISALQAGHDFVHFQLPPRYPGRYSAWLKLVALRAMLPRYDYVLYLDSDTFIRQPGMPRLVEAMIEEGGLDRGNVLALTRESPRFPDIANTGILLFRNSLRAIDLLDEWWFSLAAHHRDMQRYRREWSFEQGPFTHVVYPRFNGSIALLEFEQYNSPEGRHIRHVYSLLSNAEREAIFFAAGAAMMHQVGSAQDSLHGRDSTAACQQLVMLVNAALLEKIHG